MTKFPWKLKYIAKYILKAFVRTAFPLTQKKCPKIYVVTLVLPLKVSTEIGKKVSYAAREESRFHLVILPLVKIAYFPPL